MTELARVLLVEDDEDDVELILNALTKYNLRNEVIVARDGEEALDYMYRRGRFESRQKGNPILVLLDIKMPKVDGLEVLHTIRTDGELKLVPVVMLTSSRENPDLKRSYELGANAYVVKPLDFHEFVNAVQQIGGFWALVNEAPPGSSR